MNDETTPTYFEARKWASFRIKDQPDIDMYDIDYLLRKRADFSVTDLLIHYQDHLSAKNWQTFQSDVLRLLKSEPVQYIVGVADFYGLTFKVTPDVLIPRVETEELVDWILSETAAIAERPIRVLDIGTGSGAIAIALKKNRPRWRITGSDISNSPLRIAAENAGRQQVEISLIKSDVFETISGLYDLIVSNPPYIAADERKYMDEQVLDYEPASALFAPDDGLAIYKQIALGLSEHLASQGRLFLEIGFHQEKAVKQLLAATMPAAVILTKHDVAGNQRMIELKK